MALFPQSLDEIDFWDLDMFTDGDPHLAWTLLRREAPMWFHDHEGSSPFWCVTRYEDVHAVLADPIRFSSREMVQSKEPAEGPEVPEHLRSILFTRSAPARAVAQGGLPQFHSWGDFRLEIS